MLAIPLGPKIPAPGSGSEGDSGVSGPPPPGPGTGVGGSTAGLGSPNPLEESGCSRPPSPGCPEWVTTVADFCKVSGAHDRGGKTPETELDLSDCSDKRWRYGDNSRRRPQPSPSTDYSANTQTAGISSISFLSEHWHHRTFSSLPAGFGSHHRARLTFLFAVF